MSTEIRKLKKEGVQFYPQTHLQAVINGDTLAKKNGYYQQLIAGAADNLNGRGTVEAEYTRRTSGGDADLGTGTAQIAKLKGKSLVWNQLNDKRAAGTSESNNITFTFDSNGKLTIIVGTGGATSNVSKVVSTFGGGDWIIGHKYLCKVRTDFSFSSTTIRFGNNYYMWWDENAYIWTASGGTGSLTAQVISGCPAGTYIVDVPIIIDLTLMFGAGNEPATVEEFEALFPLDYYDYNEGEIKSLQDFAIETVGFNQWDEEWELGSLNYTTGDKDISSTAIVTKNYIPVLPNTTYYRNVPASYGDAHSPCRCAFYDANFNYLGGSNGDSSAWIEFDGQATFTSPNNAYYLRFTVANTTYNNDICINLCWSGYRNGEYEAYWKESVSYPVTKLVGKLNGEGANVKPFADGFKSAGNVHDEIVGKKLIKRVGTVDLGTLTWYKTSSGSYIGTFYAGVDDRKTGMNILCGHYTTVSLSANLPDKCITEYAASDISIRVKDTTYSDTATFKTAMSGVMLYYELEEPLEYDLIGIEKDGSVTPLEELPMNYRVDDFGTEERTPADTASSVMPPVWYDVKYAMNAVDILRRLGTNYIKKSSMDHILTAMVSAGIIGSYTLTYNATNDDYNCTVTAPTPAS